MTPSPLSHHPPTPHGKIWEKKKRKDEKEIPYYLGGFDIIFINFINF
jgi:hypothetical protein